MEVDATIPDEIVEEDVDYVSAMKLAVSDDEDGGGADRGGSQVDSTTLKKAGKENGGSANESITSDSRKKLLVNMELPEGEELLGFEEETTKWVYAPVEAPSVEVNGETATEDQECAVVPPKKSRYSTDVVEGTSKTKAKQKGAAAVKEAAAAAVSPVVPPASPAPKSSSPRAKPASSPAAAVVTSTTSDTPVEPPMAAPATPQVIAATVAPATTTTTTPKVKSPKDESYRKPFELGWKRELVYRANPEASKDKADVYYITPSGKKTRSRNDVLPHLSGELTIDNFCFTKEPLGYSPDQEIVRSAKPTHRSMAEPIVNSNSSATSSGKRVSKPKAPKGASPPPQGWTPTRALKNLSTLNLNSNSNAATNSAAPSPKSTPRSSKNRKVGDPQPCTMQCAAAMGMIPQLQCIKCLCLYHHECVGLDRANSQYKLTTDADGGYLGQQLQRKDYVCQSCIPPVDTSTTKENQVTLLEPEKQILLAALSQPPPPPPPLPAVAPSTSSQASIPFATPIAPPVTLAVPTSTTTSPPVAPVTKLNNTVPEPPAVDLPQSIAVIKGKKYVVVKKPIQRVTPAAAQNNAVVTGTSADVPTENDGTNDRSKRHNSSNSTTSTAAVQSSPPVNSLQLNAPLAKSTQPLATSLTFASNFFANVSVGYGAILHILKYLKIHERPRAASVCKIWNLVAKDRSLWQTVRMKNSKVSNWGGFTAALRRGETKHLDLRKLLVSSTKIEETWSEFCRHIGTVASLEQIDMCRCSARVVETLFMTNPNLTILSALAINDDTINLNNIQNLVMLQELRLRTLDKCNLEGDLTPLSLLKNLRHLTLSSVRQLGTKAIEVIGELNNLVSLELGECNDFDSTFTDNVLPKLSNLERLRLEIGQEQCRTLDILDSVAKLENLSQLEFVNFDIKPGFDDKLSQCTNIRKLLIIPTYISQSATTNNIVLNAVLKLKDTLQVFTWGVTVELLRVTALYVDQCEDSTRKERRHFDECIPVLKPVPGSAATEPTEEEPSTGANAVPQIEILPLDKVEEILRDNLATTKFTIVKVPYHATWKQQLVE